MHPLTEGQTLYPQQRQDEILRLVGEQGRVAVSQLARQFEVTTETVRRDLSELQRRRRLRRVHGGAIPWDSDGFEPLLVHRDTQQVDEKGRIARATITELPPEGTVLLDSGSTTARVAEVIPEDSRLRIVTNSLAAARLLTEHPHLELVMLGGQVDTRTLAMVDGQTVAEVRRMTVDVVVLGTDGVSADGGLTTPYRHQAELKTAMAAAGRRVLVVADHTKVGNDQYLQFATCAEVDTLVTDNRVDDHAAAALRATGMTVVRA